MTVLDRQSYRSWK